MLYMSVKYSRERGITVGQVFFTDTYFSRMTKRLRKIRVREYDSFTNLVLITLVNCVSQKIHVCEYDFSAIRENYALAKNTCPSVETFYPAECFCWKC